MERCNGHREIMLGDLWAGLKFHSLLFASTMEVAITLNASFFLYLCKTEIIYQGKILDYCDFLVISPFCGTQHCFTQRKKEWKAHAVQFTLLGFLKVCKGTAKCFLVPIRIIIRNVSHFICVLGEEHANKTGTSSSKSADVSPVMPTCVSGHRHVYSPASDTSSRLSKNAKTWIISRPEAG